MFNNTLAYYLNVTIAPKCLIAVAICLALKIRLGCKSLGVTAPALPQTLA
jgi:hypothetical protein